MANFILAPLVPATPVEDTAVTTSAVKTDDAHEENSNP